MKQKITGLLIGVCLILLGLYGGFYVWNVWVFPNGIQLEPWWSIPVGLTILAVAVILGVLGLAIIEEVIKSSRPK